MLDVLRFWLDCGVDGFRLDVVNFYFHEPALRGNPADFHAKTQPENLGLLQRLRRLIDEYDARTTVGAVGELHHPIETMAALALY